MANAPSAATINSFEGGLKTEFTAINFPENSCTDTQNCVFTITGDVVRREGFDYENFFVTNNINRTNQAISTYLWSNVGGDGQTKVVVVQVGATLYFYQATDATLTSPLSTSKLASTVNLNSFIAQANPNDPSVKECQFSDGNGYLFVFHPDCDPFYCTYTNRVIQGNVINIQIRDFVGVVDGLPVTTRPSPPLSGEHQYNLQNQGWSTGNTWYAKSNSTYSSTTGVTAWTVQAGLNGVSQGQSVGIVNDSVGAVASGTVLSYSGTTLQITVTSVVNPNFSASSGWTIYPINTGLMNTWSAALGNFPSNADVWWTFKDTSGTFNPAATIGSVSLGSGQAPQGFYILNAFQQNRSVTSGLVDLTTVSTNVRPRTGTWFQGRVWYAGVDSSQAAQGDANFYTWTENIYFSQTFTQVSDFAKCYQNNDPTDQNSFELLPTDGGVITIQGSGSIYKLFPLQNGMLVFAANGIWFITGSQGIGFRADDYTITKISGVESTSGTSFIDVMGYPVFWNEEGIYKASPGQTGAITIENVCIGTILSFYNNIPSISKKFARGDFDFVNHEVQWCFRSTDETTLTERYQYDRILVFNIINKAFYYYTLPEGVPYIHDIRYVVGPGGTTSPDPMFKYLTSASDGAGSYNFTFSEERDTSYVDWKSYDNVGQNFVSYFITAYYMSPRKHPFYGMYNQYFKKFNVGYIYIFLRNAVNNSYKLQGQWDFTIAGNSGKWSTVQTKTDNSNINNFGMIYHRFKIRGHGLSLQIKIASVDGKPFDIMGWSTSEYFQSVP